MSAERTDFVPIAERLVHWHARHGRRHLPWQRNPTPYRVWVSEIMLQQTRVGVVIAYYERFMARFPALADLADAPLDDVLALWSGLGYYSRARNLHRAAVLVRDRHDGQMPCDTAALVALPGIGRSTAGAILALSHGDRHPILDGNVKRVLCRYHGIEGWPGRGAIERTLWTLAERHTPHEGVAAYTQAVMDLGATLCVRSRPLCSLCPIEAGCTARRDGTQARIPAPRPRRAVPHRQTAFLVLRDASGALLLERRPPSGIWGGLWCFPECDPRPMSRPPAGRASESVRSRSPRSPRSHTGSPTSGSTSIPSWSRSGAIAATLSPTPARRAGIRPAPSRTSGWRRR